MKLRRDHIVVLVGIAAVALVVGASFFLINGGGTERFNATNSMILRNAASLSHPVGSVAPRFRIRVVRTNGTRSTHDVVVRTPLEAYAIMYGARKMVQAGTKLAPRAFARLVAAVRGLGQMLTRHVLLDDSLVERYDLYKWALNLVNGSTQHLGFQSYQVLMSASNAGLAS